MVIPRYIATVLWVVSVLMLCGCDGLPGESTTESNSEPPSGDRAGPCGISFSQLIPPDWGVIKSEPLDSMCIVFYRFDLPAGGSKMAPLGAVVFRKDEDRPHDLHSYPLSLPDGQALGEHELTVHRIEALSGNDGPELVVEDTTAKGMVVAASIFAWRRDSNSEKCCFEARGSFRADGGVSVGPDQVVVQVRLPGSRSQLANQFLYKPRAKDDENKDKKNTYYADKGGLVAPETRQMMTLVMPDKPETSEYPEKTVIAFYESLTDTGKLKKLVITPTLQAFQRPDPLFGCVADPHYRVYLQQMNLDNVPAVPSQIRNGDSVTATIVATAQCVKDLGNTVDKQNNVVRWELYWERKGDRWQMKALRP